MLKQFNSLENIQLLIGKQMGGWVPPQWADPQASLPTTLTPANAPQIAFDKGHIGIGLGIPDISLAPSPYTNPITGNVYTGAIEVESQISIADNLAQPLKTASSSYFPVTINTEDTTVASGIERSVALGGQNLDVIQSDTVYVPKLNLQQYAANLSAAEFDNALYNVNDTLYWNGFPVGGVAWETLEIDNSTGTAALTQLSADISLYVYITTQGGSGPSTTQVDLPLVPIDGLVFWFKDTGNASASNQIRIFDPVGSGNIVCGQSPNEYLITDSCGEVKFVYNSGSWYVYEGGGEFEYDGTWFDIDPGQTVTVGERKQWINYRELINDGTFVNNGEAIVIQDTEYDGTYWHIIPNQLVYVAPRKQWIIHHKFRNEGTFRNYGLFKLFDDNGI